MSVESVQPNVTVDTVLGQACIQQAQACPCRCLACSPAALTMSSAVVLCSFAGDDAGLLAAADPTGRLLIWRIQMDPEADATTLATEELLNLTFDGQSQRLSTQTWATC